MAGISGWKTQPFLSLDIRAIRGDCPYTEIYASRFACNPGKISRIPSAEEVFRNAYSTRIGCSVVGNHT